MELGRLPCKSFAGVQEDQVGLLGIFEGWPEPARTCLLLETGQMSKAQRLGAEEHFLGQYAAPLHWVNEAVTVLHKLFQTVVQ